MEKNKKKLLIPYLEVVENEKKPNMTKLHTYPSTNQKNKK